MSEYKYYLPHVAALQHYTVHLIVHANFAHIFIFQSIFFYWERITRFMYNDQGLMSYDKKKGIMS